MKPARKQSVDAKKNEKSLTKNVATSQIKSYFKPTPKEFVIADETEKHGEGPKQFYIDMLKDKLQKFKGAETGDVNQIDGGACALVGTEVESVKNRDDSSTHQCAECENKQKECMEWERKYKELKRMYVKLTVNYAELDLKHKDLAKLSAGKIDNKAATSSVEGTVDGDVFSPGEIKFLECMPLDKKKDSTFILQCLQFAYKKDPKILASKSLYGTKESVEFTKDGKEVHHPAKQPITPIKASRIKELFVDRISKCDINSVEYGDRIKETNVNRLLASGIKNMSKIKM